MNTKKSKKLTGQNSVQRLEQDAVQLFLTKLEKEKFSKEDFLKAAILYLDCLTKNVLSPTVIDLSLSLAMERREEIGIQDVKKMERLLKMLLVFSEIKNSKKLNVKEGI